MFGRSPRLPIDLMFDLGSHEQLGDYQDYVKKWQRDMREAYALASRCMDKSSARSKAFYDRKASSPVLYSGDRVLVRNLSERGGPRKLRSYWERQIHVVDDRIADRPVYRVKPEHGRGKRRVLHRNLRLPCDALPLDLPKRTRVAHRTPQPTPMVPSFSLADGESSADEYQTDLPQPVAVHDTEHVAEMNTPSIDTEELCNTMDVEALPGTLFETHYDPVVDDGSQAAEGVRLSETHEIDPSPDSADSDTEDLPAGTTRPQRERRPPLTLTYNQMGTPEYQRLNPVVDTIQAPQVQPSPVLACWLLPTHTPHSSWYPWYQPQLLYGYTSIRCVAWIAHSLLAETIFMQVMNQMAVNGT